ncbi:hypothetical protein BCR39DRAFT_505588 [Naematelia encephala]|uniref:Uncharacterized protein n=1 Tax=Naematelia encephala TaxID=71784 RepID=A0A1Y2B3P9_9TREE|nr:hypothetical protein BCR39DRAFT_505588 [Naematelia encephala]
MCEDRLLTLRLHPPLIYHFSMASSLSPDTAGSSHATAGNRTRSDNPRSSTSPSQTAAPSGNGDYITVPPPGYTPSIGGISSGLPTYGESLADNSFPRNLPPIIDVSIGTSNGMLPIYGNGVYPPTRQSTSATLRIPLGNLMIELTGPRSDGLSYSDIFPPRHSDYRFGGNPIPRMDRVYCGMRLRNWVYVGIAAAVVGSGVSSARGICEHFSIDSAVCHSLYQNHVAPSSTTQGNAIFNEARSASRIYASQNSRSTTNEEASSTMGYEERTEGQSDRDSLQKALVATDNVYHSEQSPWLAEKGMKKGGRRWQNQHPGTPSTVMGGNHFRTRVVLDYQQGKLTFDDKSRRRSARRS